MKLLILSDLHLEFSMFEPHGSDADVVALAGDIAVGTKGIDWAHQAWPDKQIVYVPGNHEFYGLNRTEALADMRNIAAQNGNVRLLDENEVVINGVRFLGCTLWTDFLLFGRDRKLEAMQEAQEYLADFRMITDFVERQGWTSDQRIVFTPEMSELLHVHAVAWLKSRLAVPFDGKTVVVTHHLPSRLSVADRFKQELLSACFASELDHLFSLPKAGLATAREPGKVDLWVHGHTHDNFDYVLNGTRVVCNPRGYVTYQGTENFDFNPNLIIEI